MEVIHIILIILIIVIAIAIAVTVTVSVKAKKKSKPTFGGGIEYEYRFGMDGDAGERMRKKLTKLGAKKKDLYLMDITVYDSPEKEPLPEGHAPPMYRIRRETADKATKTIKTGPIKHRNEEEIDFPPSQIPEEHKKMIDDGFTIKYKVEKIRELWDFPNEEVHEVVFDRLPGSPELMEIDATSEEALLSTMKALGLTEADRMPDNEDAYKYFYGVPTTAEGRELPSNPMLTFSSSAKEQFEEYLDPKQSDRFDAIIKEQEKLAEKLRA